MARLIDADELKKDFRLNFGGVSHAEADCEIIDRQPAIDTERLRPKAHWISDSLYVDGKRKFLQWCSLCNCPGLRETEYCPHCGAKMEDESDET